MKKIKQCLAICIILTFVLVSCLPTVSFAAEFGADKYEFNLAEFDVVTLGNSTVSEKQYVDSGVVRVITTTQKGDGAEYTVNIPQAGNYCVKLILNATTMFDVNIDGVDVSGIMSARSTWFEYNLGNFVCNQPGDKVIKFTAQSSGVKEIMVGSISFEMTNDRYYHVPEFSKSIRISDPLSSSYVLTKDLHYEAMTFKPDGFSVNQTEEIAKNKYIEFDITSDREGLYSFELEFKGGAGKGIYNVFVNDRLVKQGMDLYSPNIYTETSVKVANVSLKKGTNTVKFECIGKNPLSSNFNLIVYSLDFHYLSDFVEDDESAEDTEDVINPDTEAINVLYNLGIIKSANNYSPIVTRAEFASIIASLVNYSQLEGTNPFDDVKNNNKYINEICFMHDAGLMVGDGVNFRPDDKISVPEILKVLTYIMGYEAQAEALGGYPFGYATVINSKKIFKNTGVGLDENEISFNDLTEIIYDILDEEVLSVTSIIKLKNDSNNIIYGTEGVNTVLGYYHEIYESKGVVEQNYITGLYNTEGNISDSFINIGGVKYNCSDINVHNYLGYNVKFYYSETQSGTDVLKCAVPYKTNITTVSAQDIAGFSGHTFEYYEGTKIRKIYFSPSAKVIYNKKLLVGYLDSDLMPLHGRVTLIDNNNDGSADVVCVDSVDSYYVKSTDAVSELVYTKGSSVATVSLKDDDLTPTEIYFEGKKVEFSEIAVGDIITVGKSKIDNDVVYTNVHISRKSLTGNITYTIDDDIAIEDIEYSLTPQYNTFLAGNISTGVYVKAFLDIYGKIAYMTLDGSGGQGTYGYIIKGGIVRKNVFDSKYLLKIFNEFNELVLLPISENLKINDRKIVSNVPTSSDQAWSTLYDSSAEGLVKSSVISYSINSVGEITKIVTPSVNSDAILRYGSTAEYDSQSVKYVYTPTSKYFTKTPSSGYEAGFRYNNNTLIFFVPSDKTNDNAYEIVPSSVFKSDHSYYLKAYNIDDVRNAGILVWEDSYTVSDTNDKDNFACVSRVSTVYVEDEVYYEITVMDQGKEVGLMTEDISNLSTATIQLIQSIKVGDVISYTLTVGQRIRTLSIRQSLDQQISGYSLINPRGAFSYGLTKVYRVLGNDITVGNGVGDTTSMMSTALDLSTCNNIVYFDKNSKKVKVGSVSDIRAGMSLYVKTSYGKPIGVWIIGEQENSL